MIYHTFTITFIYSIFIYRGFIEMYSYNTLIIHNVKNVNYFLKIKFFLKNIDIFGK